MFFSASIVPETHSSILRSDPNVYIVYCMASGDIKVKEIENAMFT